MERNGYVYSFGGGINKDFMGSRGDKRRVHRDDEVSGPVLRTVKYLLNRIRLNKGVVYTSCKKKYLEESFSFFLIRFVHLVCYAKEKSALKFYECGRHKRKGR